MSSEGCFYVQRRRIWLREGRDDRSVRMVSSTSWVERSERHSYIRCNRSAKGRWQSTRQATLAMGNERPRGLCGAPPRRL